MRVSATLNRLRRAAKPVLDEQVFTDAESRALARRGFQVTGWRSVDNVCSAFEGACPPGDARTYRELAAAAAAELEKTYPTIEGRFWQRIKHPEKQRLELELFHKQFVEFLGGEPEDALVHHAGRFWLRRVPAAG